MAAFAEHGFANAGMSQIAEDAGSTKPTLYAHFGSKENLFNRVVQRELTRIVTDILPRYDEVGDQGIEESVDTLITVGMNYISANPQARQLIRVSIEASADPMLSQFLAINEIFTAKVAELVERHLETIDAKITSGNPRAIAATIVGSGIALAHHMLVHGDDDFERLARMLSTFLSGGLQALTHRR